MIIDNLECQWSLMDNSHNTNTVNNTLNKHNISILNYVNNNYQPTKSLNKLNDIETYCSGFLNLCCLKF